MSDRAPTQEENLAKLRELVEDIKVACLVTIDSNDALHARPMATQALDSDAELWFFTNDYSAKVDNVRLHPQVCVSYAAPDKNRYVSISGTAELVRDADKIRELWTPMLKAWFPQGVEDPDLALIRIDIVSAQYWDATSNKLVQLFSLVKAIAKGESAAADLGESEKLTVRSRIGSDTAT